ncbi:MAG: hypothetical protein JST16_02335 [Bdellovibrionales bacterium]|nr:hypothetical protein [Bdellovibrionales bacterium]
MKSVPRSALLPPGAEIKTFEMPALKGQPLPTYQQIKDTFDPGAMPKQNLFALSELVAGQLSVEHEEQKRFDKRVGDEVEARLKILKAEAHETAFKRGLEEGQQKAYEEEKARIAKHLEDMASSINSITKAKALLAEQYETLLVETIFRVSKVLLHKELEIEPQAIHATIAAILEKIGKEDDVRIRLASAEFEAIDKIKEEVEKLGRQGRISFEMDGSLKAGNCIVDSLSGEIASFIDEKLELLKSEITKARTSRREAAGA